MRLFIDEEKLGQEYVPPTLPHREAELHLLKTFFKGVTSGTSFPSNKVLITGAIGTGKTALAKLLGVHLEREATQNNVTLRYMHLNCRINRTLFTIIKRLVELLKVPLPSRGYSDEELMHGLLDYISQKSVYLVLALDETEVLIKEEGSEPFYFLTRIGEEIQRERTRLSLMFILRNPEILNVLDGSTRSSLLSNVVHLQEYDATQLSGILFERVREAFAKDVVLEDTVRLIADIAGERGDARYAIELLWRAGKYAEFEESEKVSPEHARKAAATVYPVKRENLLYLSHHEQIILLAVSRLLQKTEKAYITSAEVNEGYRVVCEEFQVPPKGYTRFWEHLQKLEDLGIIRIKVSSEGSRGRRSYITLPEIPVTILSHELKTVLAKKRSET